MSPTPNRRWMPHWRDQDQLVGLARGDRHQGIQALPRHDRHLVRPRRLGTDHDGRGQVERIGGHEAQGAAAVVNTVKRYVRGVSCGVERYPVRLAARGQVERRQDIRCRPDAGFRRGDRADCWGRRRCRRRRGCGGGRWRHRYAREVVDEDAGRRGHIEIIRRRVKEQQIADLQRIERLPGDLHPRSIRQAARIQAAHGSQIEPVFRVSRVLRK